MTRVHRLLALGLLALANVQCSQPPKVLCADCNVVLITIDTLRADHLGTYGYVRDTSPNIDGLARESIVFEQAIVAWPKTVPGLGSILTGNYGRTVRMMYATFDPMREDSTMLSEMLKENGYTTGGYVTNGNLQVKQGWSQGFDEYKELWKEVKGRGSPANVAEHGKEFIDAHKEEKFFLWLHYIDPHAPYWASDRELRDKFVKDEHYDEIFYDKDRKREIELHKTPPYTWRNFGINGVPGSVIQQERTEVAHYIAQYDGEVRLTDRYIGEVIDHLKAKELWGKTLVVLTADHGEALGGHDWYFDHGRFAYDDVNHVPMMFHVPGLAPARLGYPMSSNDIVPTTLDLLGIERQWPMDGTSLVPVIEGTEERGPEYVFTEAGYNRDCQRTVRDGTWKLLYVPAREARSVMQGELFELYNVEKDPLETVNLAGSEPEVLERLKTALFDWMKKRMPPLDAFEMVDGVTLGYKADWDSPGVAVEGDRFYARVRGTVQARDHCFTLAVPNPEARITIELLEANTRQRPHAVGPDLWDDSMLSEKCVGDEWGCLRINGERVPSLPYTVRLGDLGDRVDPYHLSLHGEGNDKTFCFRTGEFGKRPEKTKLGYVVEVAGHVRTDAAGAAGYGDLDDVTRDNLKELGYIQ